MKKLYYLFTGIAMILISIVACEKSSIGVDEMQTLQKQDVAAKLADKVNICHWDEVGMVWENISISPSAVDKHMSNHNDHYPGDIYQTSFVYFKYLEGVHSMTFTFTDSDFTGIGKYIGGTLEGFPNDLTSSVSGTVEGNTFEGVYKYDNFMPWIEFKIQGVLDDCGNIVEISGEWFNGPVFPSEEVCDGLDNDFDGQVDEGVKTTFYQDLDGDTFGNPLVFVEACEAPDGYVLDNTDCDDTKFPYSPKGTYTFKYQNKDVWIHYYTITEFNPITGKFSGTGSNLNPDTEIITGTVSDTGILTGNILYNNSGYTLDISGTVGECGGIISLDDFVKY